VTAAQIGARAAAATQAYRSKRTEMLAKFLEQISAAGDFAGGLTHGQPNLLSFIESTGAVILFDEVCVSTGIVPSDTVLINIRDWLADRPGEPLFLPTRFPSALPSVPRMEVDGQRCDGSTDLA
jgi:light-regulated signal transduction histidine kinase (bacteriophytochrome)